ncbi:sensor histidine kinase [Actinomadura fulvescens]|uniref:Anti-sigma factor RsbA family regulatory protein n=1 Tax=Actinomadura fulvescens TaxID=46160 RepID=A0ABN3PV34_9ACTN
MSETFSHRVLPYDGIDDFLAGAVPFLNEGIDAGDRVLAVTGLSTEVRLREALGSGADGVEFVEANGWYAHPSRTLADCLADADRLREQGRRLRVLGEPAWTGRRPLEVLEWQRIEAIVNVAFAETGAALLCPYARTLPPGVVAAARRTHPETLRGSRAVDNPSYVNPWTYSAMCDEEALPDPPAWAARLDIEQPDLFWLRAWVTECARRTPLAEDDLQRLLVAVTEVVTNALRHGAPPIVLRLWTEPGELVCEVRDGGRWTAGSGFGLLPPRADGPGRFGLWAVRLLCSIVQIRTGAGGTTVRLRLALPSVPAMVRA